MSDRTTQRSYCRICIATCGLVVEVEDGRALSVRGDAAHPLSAGYACSKGRALPGMHHGPERLDVPLMRGAEGTGTGAEGLAAAGWDEVMGDLDGRLGAIVRESGPGAVGFFIGGGMFNDGAGYWATRRLLRRLDTRNCYSTMSIDAAAKYRVGELMAGTHSLVPHAVPDAGLVLLLGTNPVVSHGQSPMFENPVERLRSASRAGEVWVIDPRATESSLLADRHLPIRPGTDHALLAFVIRCLLNDDGPGPGEADPAGAHQIDRDALGRRAINIGRLAEAVAPYTLQRAASETGLPEQDLLDLVAAVRRSGRLAVLTGTGVTMSPGGNAAEWLVWSLLVITDSFDRPGGMWFNPGYMARLDEREHLPSTAPTEPGAPTRPEIPRLMNEWPAAVIPDEIEAGNLRALFVLGGNLVTALPDTARVAAALPQLDLLVVLDVVSNATTPYATHVLPCHAQLERPDVPLLNDLFNPRVFAQYTRALLARGEHRRSAWWIMARIGRALGVEVLPSSLDPETATDDDVLDAVAGAGVLDRLRAGDHPWAEAPSPVFGWAGGRLPLGVWDLAPEPLVEQMAALEPPGELVLTPRRQPKRFNGQHVRDGDAPEVLLHPLDAAACGVVDGDQVEVCSQAGSLRLRARVTDRTRRGAASIPHGWETSNVNHLISARDLDPLTGMPKMSGTSVTIARVAPTAEPAE